MEIAITTKIKIKAATWAVTILMLAFGLFGQSHNVLAYDPFLYKNKMFINNLAQASVQKDWLINKLYYKKWLYTSPFQVRKYPTPTKRPSLTITQTPSVTPTKIPTQIPSPSKPTPTILQVTPQPPRPSEVPGYGPELIINGNLEEGGEDPQGWLRGNWGNNSAVFTYPVTGDDSNKAAKVEITQYEDGDAKWFFNEINVTPNLSYEFRDRYISNVETTITVKFNMGNNTYNYIELVKVPASEGWSTASSSFTVPANAVSASVFHLVSAVGNLVIDNVSLREKHNLHKLSEGLVSFDFDDGWLSTYQNGLPILDAAGIKSTQYIISNYLNEADGYINTTQLLDMQSRGHEIGSHTKSHPHLTLLSQEQLSDEIAGSRNSLLLTGAGPVNSFDYPYGEWNTMAYSTVKASGYKSARTALMTDGGFNFKDTDPFLLKTQPVDNETTLNDFKSWIDTALNTNSWVILVFHQIDDGGGQYSVSPQLLQDVVNYVKQVGIKTVTVSQGVGYLN